VTPLKEKYEAPSSEFKITRPHSEAIVSRQLIEEIRATMDKLNLQNQGQLQQIYSLEKAIETAAEKEANFKLERKKLQGCIEECQEQISDLKMRLIRAETQVSEEQREIARNLELDLFKEKLKTKSLQEEILAMKNADAKAKSQYKEAIESHSRLVLENAKLKKLFTVLDDSRGLANLIK
jgi:chromosome segregation ATPase